MDSDVEGRDDGVHAVHGVHGGGLLTLILGEFITWSLSPHLPFKVEYLATYLIEKPRLSLES